MKGGPEISAVVLAGGENKRMGSPKAFLSIGGKRIIDLMLDKLREIFREIIIVVNKNNFAEFCKWAKSKEVKVVEDLVENKGPMGGIYTGLSSISNKKGFFFACDMPFLHKGLIKRLIDADKSKIQYDCIIPRQCVGIEPLHALYTKGMLNRLKESLDKDELCLKSFLKKSYCKYVKVKKEETPSLININTPEEYEKLKGRDN